MCLGNYSVKQYTLTKPLQHVSGSVHLQKNFVKSFDATDGLVQHMKVRSSPTQFSHIHHLLHVLLKGFRLPQTAKVLKLLHRKPPSTVSSILAVFYMFCL